MTIDSTLPTREWGVLLKVRVRPEGPTPRPAQLDRILIALPGNDKKLTGAGRDFTIAFWVEATNAALATETAAALVRELAAAEGLTELSFIRSHAASVEGRFPTFIGTGSRLDTPNEWAVEFKAGAPAGADPATPEILNRIRDAMHRPDVSVTFHGDQEKFLLDNGRGVTVRFWSTAQTTAGALRAARGVVLSGLSQAGLEDWTLIRLKAWDPRHMHADTFPGARARVPAVTEEIR